MPIYHLNQFNTAVRSQILPQTCPRCGCGVGRLNSVSVVLISCRPLVFGHLEPPPLPYTTTTQRKEKLNESHKRRAKIKCVNLFQMEPRGYYPAAPMLPVIDGYGRCIHFSKNPDIQVKVCECRMILLLAAMTRTSNQKSMNILIKAYTKTKEQK